MDFYTGRYLAGEPKVDIHSKFLVHWTGNKQIHPSAQSITDDMRDKYVELLFKCCTEGLWMKPGTEIIHGMPIRNPAGEGLLQPTIETTIPQVCFSEIRLSQVHNHAKKYGKLGIGFHRDFVLERMGNPVFYVQNGDKGVVIQNFVAFGGFLEVLRGQDFLNAIKTLKNQKAQQDLKNVMTVAGQVHNGLAAILGLCKGLSKEKNSMDFGVYDAMEWRVIHLHLLEGEYIDARDNKYWLKLEPQDIKLLIFPDEPTKLKAIKHPDLRKWFEPIQDKHVPMMTTIEECENF